MKKISTTLLFLALGTKVFFAQIGVNTPDPKATFDITAKTTDGSKPEGMIAPRLTGDQIKSADNQYTTLQKGVIIYATSAVGTASAKTANITAEGYYYFDGNIWQKFNNSYKGSESVMLNPGDNSFIRAKLEGDVDAAANYNIVTVKGLQGKPVAAGNVPEGSLLYFTGGMWVPISRENLGIPRRMVTAHANGNQNLLGSYPNGYIQAFGLKEYDIYGAWDVATNIFTVPAGMGGTYTINAQTGNLHTQEAQGLSPYWNVLIMERSQNYGAYWTRIIANTSSGLFPQDIDNGNTIVWTGWLYAGEKIRFRASYSGSSNNITTAGNLNITRLAPPY